MNADILREIAPPDNDCCKLAYLSGAVHTAATLELAGERKLTFQRPGIGDKLNAPLVELFGMTAENNEIRGDVLRLLAELGVVRTDDGGLLYIEKGIDPHVVVSDCCKAAYLAGAFIGCGSLSVSPGNSRLKFSVNYVELAEGLSGLLGHLGIHSFLSEHKDKFDVCVKRRQSISDCLVLMGAPKAMLRFSTDAALYEKRADLNRVNNIEVANIGKTVSAGLKQTEAVKLIAARDGLDSLEPKLRETAELRLTESAMTYEEMARRLGVSKGSVKYRLKRLEEIAFGHAKQEEL